MIVFVAIVNNFFIYRNHKLPYNSMIPKDRRTPGEISPQWEKKETVLFLSNILSETCFMVACSFSVNFFFGDKEVVKDDITVKDF